MNADFNSRYDISRFVTSSQQRQKITDPKFQQLQSKYQQRLQTLSNDPGTQALFNNKFVAALFLDKVPKTSVVLSDVRLVQKYGLSSSTLDSMQIILYLQAIKDDSRLAPETRQAIDNWIATEREYLDIAIILDGWRVEHSQIMGLLKSGLTGSFSLDKLKFSPPQEEIKSMAEALAHQLQSLQPGQTFKMLGGYHIHETRLSFKKEPDGTFTLYHYNTAEQRIEKYVHMDPKTLGDSQFWQTFLALKLDRTNMDKMSELLQSVGTKVTGLSEQDKLARKSQQKSDSCPAQAAEADLKHEIVRSFTDPRTGEQQYKLLKSLMAEKAVTVEAGQVEPRLFALLQSKERIKRRYLEWKKLEQNPQQMQSVEDLYRKLIALFDPIDTPRVGTTAELRRLDDRLNTLLKTASPTQLQQVKSLHDELWPQSQSPIIALKFFTQSANIKQAVNEVFATVTSLSSQTKSLLRSLMPQRLQSYLETPHLLTQDVLTQYLRSEKPTDAVPIVVELLKQLRWDSSNIQKLLYDTKIPPEAFLPLAQEAFQQNLLTPEHKLNLLKQHDLMADPKILLPLCHSSSETDLKELLNTHSNANHPATATALAKMISDKDVNDPQLKTMCQLILDPSKLDLSTLPFPKKQVLRLLAQGKHKTQAIPLLKQWILEAEPDELNAYKFIPSQWSLEILSELIAEQKCRSWMLSHYLKSEATPAEQIQLLDRYFAHKAAFIPPYSLNPEVIRYLYEQRKTLTPLQAIQHLNSTSPKTPFTLSLEKDLLRDLEQGLIPLPEAYDLFKYSKDTSLKKTLADYLIKQPLNEEQRITCLSIADPEQMLNHFANDPNLFSNRFLNDLDLVRNLPDISHVLRLAHIVAEKGPPNYLASCFDRLLDKDSDSIPSLFDQYLQNHPKAKPRYIAASFSAYLRYDSYRSIPQSLVLSMQDVFRHRFGMTPSEA